MSSGDLVNRGARGNDAATPLGTTIFVGLRALDPILQRMILQTNPLSNFHSQLSLRSGAPSGDTLIRSASLDLTPFQTVIWAMSVGSAVKQIYWILVTAKEPMYPSGALIISLFNTLNNSLNTLLFTIAASNPTWSPLTLYAGAALYTVGILVEPIAETQRKIFKEKKENTGKPYSGGLFGLARNINYGAYTLWRGGMALAAGGPVWGGLAAAFFFYDFSNRAVPTLDEYCSKRYGEQWQEVKRKVPYKLFPLIY